MLSWKGSSAALAWVMTSSSALSSLNAEATGRSPSGAPCEKKLSSAGSGPNLLLMLSVGKVWAFSCLQDRRMLTNVWLMITMSETVFAVKSKELELQKVLYCRMSSIN